MVVSKREKNDIIVCILFTGKNFGTNRFHVNNIDAHGYGNKKFSGCNVFNVSQDCGYNGWFNRDEHKIGISNNRLIFNNCFGTERLIWESFFKYIFIHIFLGKITLKAFNDIVSAG